MSDTKTTKGRKAAPKVESRPPGRQSTFSQEMADEICEHMANGESLRDICLRDNMPNRSTVARWLAAHEQFRDQYAHACEMRQDELFDQLIHIADTPQLGSKSVSKATGLEITEADMIEHRRLQVEARKWALGKMAPKKYGDKVQQELSGPNGGPIKSESSVTISAEEAYKRLLNGGT